MFTCLKAPEFSNDLKNVFVSLKLEFLEIASLLAGGPTELYSLAIVTVFPLTEAAIELTLSVGLIKMVVFFSFSFLRAEG